MDEIRVLLINLGGVLGDVIKAELVNASNLSVVGDFSGVSDVRAKIIGTGAEVVVCGDGDAADIASFLFERSSRVKVIAVRDDGRHAVLWKLYPERSILGDLSPGLLVDTVRTVGFK